MYLPAARLTFFVREGHLISMCGSSSPLARIIFVSADLSPISFGPNLDAREPILCSRIHNGLLVMSTSRADVFSTSGPFALRPDCIFITRGSLPIACGPFLRPFLHAGLCAYLYASRMDSRFYSQGPQRTFSNQVRGPFSPQADLCGSRAHRFMLQTDLCPLRADLLRSSRRTFQP